MATYPIKMLKDESNVPFVPLVSTGCVTDPQGRTLEQMLANKLEASNFTAGTNISLTVSGNDITITNTAPGTSLIDNLNQSTAGAGALDAHQGKVLKELIPNVIDNVTTVSTTDALSAYQGYLLAGKIVPSGGTTGQVLKKTTGTDWDLEWGDAADPNAISGDGTIKKIVYCTLAEYNALTTIDPDTEYHIEEVQSDLSYIDRDEIEEMIEDNVINNLTSTSTTNALSAYQGKLLNDNKLDKTSIKTSTTSSSSDTYSCNYIDDGLTVIGSCMEVKNNTRYTQACTSWTNYTVNMEGTTTNNGNNLLQFQSNGIKVSSDKVHFLYVYGNMSCWNDINGSQFDIVLCKNGSSFKYLFDTSSTALGDYVIEGCIAVSNGDLITLGFDMGGTNNLVISERCYLGAIVLA